MSQISISVSESVQPEAEVLTLEDGQRFIVLRFGDGSTLIGPGFGRDSSEYARAMAMALIQAANQLDDAVAVLPAVAETV